MRARRISTLLLLVMLASCRTSRAAEGAAIPLPPLGVDASASFDASTPSREGLEPDRLRALTDWVAGTEVPIFSILISRRGHLVYELYTSNLGRDDAHYLMSVTKSFTSALTGIAIDRGVISSADATVPELFPRELFASEADRARFAHVTLKDVLAMSALDAQVPPHRTRREDRARQSAFLASRNRAAFALSQSVLPEPGVSFQYTDVTPLLAVGAISYGSGESAFDFAREHLFEPLGFRNAEWMHQDACGLDNGAYGLRLRPIDMQKFGVLFLRGGDWNGTPLISKAWVAQSFSPWIRSRPGSSEPNYGWYWWANTFSGAAAHVANGWRGQRIAVLPAEELVVTMTSDIEDGSEEAIFAKVMNDFVIPAVRAAPTSPRPGDDDALRARLDEVRSSTRRIAPGAERRMVPSAAPREVHHAFQRCLPGSSP